LLCPDSPLMHYHQVVTGFHVHGHEVFTRSLYVGECFLLILFQALCSLEVMTRSVETTVRQSQFTRLLQLSNTFFDVWFDPSFHNFFICSHFHLTCMKASFRVPSLTRHFEVL